jgi:photosystem II stability/assembly factor-like uncharacterized protein
MKKVFTILLLFSSVQVFAQGFWRTLNIEPAPRYDDIYFINEKTGWAAGGGSGKIHKTTDGGLTWTELIKLNNYLRSIEFMNAEVGFCGGMNGGSLYRTRDGGKSWENIGSTILADTLGVCGLARADINTIYGVGVWYEPAFVIKSTDKGENWTFIDMSMYASSLIDVFFFDAIHGFVTGSATEGEGGVVLYTDDGGKTWVEKFRTEEPGDRIWKIQTPDRKHFYGSVESFFGKTRMIRSSNKGQTWDIVTVNPEFYYIQAVGFIDSLRGWTGGGDFLFETGDGGDTWKKVTLGSTYNRFQKINEGIAYLTGNRVYKFRRTTGTSVPDPDPVTSIPDPEPYDPIHYLTISPNPTTGKSDLHIRFGTRTMAHVYLYSTVGKNIQKIYAGFAESGERVFPIDVSDQLSQVYIVVLKTSEGTVSAKLVRE